MLSGTAIVFRAISMSVYGSQSEHGELRKAIANHMLNKRPAIFELAGYFPVTSLTFAITLALYYVMANGVEKRYSSLQQTFCSGTLWFTP